MYRFKGALSDLRQVLATEKPLIMMKNTFCFTLKAFFVLFSHVEKQYVKR